MLIFICIKNKKCGNVIVYFYVYLHTQKIIDNQILRYDISKENMERIEIEIKKNKYKAWKIRDWELNEKKIL